MELLLLQQQSAGSATQCDFTRIERSIPNIADATTTPRQDSIARRLESSMSKPV